MEIGTVGVETKFLEVERPLYGIAVVAELDDTLNTNLSVSPDQAAEQFAALASKCLVSIHIELKDGNKHRLVTNKPLTTLLDLAQHGEGSIIIKSQVLRGMIPLTDSGALQFIDDEKLVIKVENQSGCFDSIDFYSIDFPTIATEYKTYTYLEVGDKTDKTFGIRDYAKLMFKLSEVSDSTEIELKYTNGSICAYKINELVALGFLVNDASYVVNGTICTGWGIHAIIDVSNCVEVHINRTNSDPFSIVAVQQNFYGNTVVAMQKNDMKDVALEEAQFRGTRGTAG